MRANFGQQECRLNLTGSDVLEDLWSKNGQWVGNHHNYNFCDLRRNSSHMVRLEHIRVDPFAPEFAKPHPKQESIWARQYADGFVKAPLDDYPTPELVEDTLRDGLSTAQDLVRSIGMAPNDTCEYEGEDNSCDDDDDHDHDGRGGRTDENRQGNGKGMEVNDWFYHPFRYPGNKFGRGSTIGDEQDDHPDSGDDVDTTNGITCLSGTEWLI